VQFLVLHATETDFPKALEILTHGDVSSHYLVDRDGHIYRLVEEGRRAWHSGPSYWQGATPLNPGSIGIEIVNVERGAPDGVDSGYPEPQVSAVLALVRDIAHRHEIRPHRIVGHGEVLPEDKTDPGILFPWHRLYEAGLVPEPDPAVVAHMRATLGDEVPSPAWFQSRLSQHGYRVTCSGVLDEATRRVIAVFQGRYRPRDARGEPDLETAALLAATTESGGLRILVGDQPRPYRIDPAQKPRCDAH
jgi:N-acetylmuramoyl-L-alanine amidase